ncbi:hypothetical protein TREMEDRAFT_24290 [Tremella mesenterica DSM 1558]|uniref:uncharacterized protein n=1 Tax=Tremella mesenterica (strain ATCC 24925 / CBS 8224 / DSM 1558 / NBRC 9311 / NRRL Y-6157 / RJB 2259-6 / UBC 559-6) TaxID=578456 RepID=UPI0003F48DE9|nr:uncharacterized protein TREMEDRAFT_24290 [Tremella mesenterica DSM 1558]EIW72403.1 hypothetical protein TREMEDRAFT_24290 [Tremella mesenterica DSM 1558]
MPPKGSKLGPPPTTTDPSSPALVQQNAHSSSIADFELPKTTLTKLAKGSIPDNVKMQQDVVLALLRGSTLFISYLWYKKKNADISAHDQALARSGKSITASDVIKAISEMDFGPADDLIPILEHELAAYRANVQANKSAKKAVNPGPGGKRGPRKSNAATDVEEEQGDEEEDDMVGDDAEEEEGQGEVEGEGDESEILDAGDEMDLDK